MSIISRREEEEGGCSPHDSVIYDRPSIYERLVNNGSSLFINNSERRKLMAIAVPPLLPPCRSALHPQEAEAEAGRGQGRLRPVIVSKIATDVRGDVF